jgi:hypothetical protein
MGPGLARIHGFEHADAVGILAADVGLAGAHVNNVGVGGRHRNGADGTDRNAFVGDGKPGTAGVFGLPHAAANGTGIKGVGLAGVARDGVRASAAQGADVAPTQAGQQAAGILTRGVRLLGEDREPQPGHQAQRGGKNKPTAST